MSEHGSRKTDDVASTLMNRIVSGAIPVGAVLPRESDLADRFGVNRSVVREAVKLLEVHRLVRPVRRKGTEVLDPSASMSPEVLCAMLSPRSGVVDQRALVDLLEVRAEIDVLIAGLAAERRTDSDVDALEEAIETVREALTDRLASTGRYADAVDAFSLIAARATHNRVLEMMSHWNRTVIEKLGDVFRVARPAQAGYVQGLELLCALIKGREVEQARRVTRAYHDWAKPRILAAAALYSGDSTDELVVHFHSNSK